MTALIMGAGYIAGAYFFIRVAGATRWHRVHLGFLPITAFTALLGAAAVRDRRDPPRLAVDDGRRLAMDADPRSPQPRSGPGLRCSR